MDNTETEILKTRIGEYLYSDAFKDEYEKCVACTSKIFYYDHIKNVSSKVIREYIKTILQNNSIEFSDVYV